MIDRRRTYIITYGDLERIFWELDAADYELDRVDMIRVALRAPARSTNDSHFRITHEIFDRIFKEQGDPDGPAKKNVYPFAVRE